MPVSSNQNQQPKERKKGQESRIVLRIQTQNSRHIMTFATDEDYIQ